MLEEYLRNKNHPKMALVQNISISSYVPPCLSSKVIHILQVNFHYRLTIGYSEHWLTIVRDIEIFTIAQPYLCVDIMTIMQTCITVLLCICEQAKSRP